jgi:hypothetical protein
LLGKFLEWSKGKKNLQAKWFKDGVIEIDHPTKNNSKPPKGGRNTFIVLKKTINTCFREDGKKGMGTRSSSKS